MVPGRTDFIPCSPLRGTSVVPSRPPLELGDLASRGEHTMPQGEKAGIRPVEVNARRCVLANPRPHPPPYCRDMHEPDDTLPLFARTTIMWALVRRGGSLRIGPLLKVSGLSVDHICALLNELAERSWLRIAWRRTPLLSVPEPLRYVDRITATRFGRSRMIPLERRKTAKRRRRRRRSRKSRISRWRRTCMACPLRSPRQGLPGVVSSKDGSAQQERRHGDDR